MIRAEDIADPGTMFWLLLLVAFLIGLVVHTVLGARHILWISTATTIVFTMVLYSTIYRGAPAQDAMWMIGLVIGFSLQLVTVIGAGFLLRQMRQLRGL